MKHADEQRDTERENGFWAAVPCNGTGGAGHLFNAWIRDGYPTPFSCKVHAPLVSQSLEQLEAENARLRAAIERVKTTTDKAYERSAGKPGEAVMQIMRALADPEEKP